MIPQGISDEGLVNMAFHGRFGGVALVESSDG
jgi:hypothetical protein